MVEGCDRLIEEMKARRVFFPLSSAARRQNGPGHPRATAKLVYGSDEVRNLLERVGLQDIEMIPRSVASRTIVFAISNRR